MLRRSIPGYETMRQLTRELALDHAGAGPVIDLGASRGDAVADLVDRIPPGPEPRFHLVETSPPMLRVLRQRFADRADVAVHDLDLREAFPSVSGASLVLAVLTLQFVPIECRQRVVQRVHDALAPGGVLLLVEKILGSTPDTHDLLGHHYHRHKARHGYTREQIDRKRLALQGVLVPVTADWNTQLLQSAGFGHIECYWRHLNFAGWIARK
jgi:tRNA (cmo5U34)-methyltransferase